MASQGERLDVFVQGNDNALRRLESEGEGFGAWESLGGVITSKPAVVAWRDQSFDVFGRGPDGALRHSSLSHAW